MPCLGKKQVGAGTDMRVVFMCAFYLAFCTSKKQAVRPDGTGHPLPLAAHLLKRQGAAQLHKKSHYPGRDRASSAADKRHTS